MPQWTIQDARELYNISRWGNKLFDINPAGHVVALDPKQPNHSGVDLFQLVQSLRERNVNLPVLVRFPDYLRHRIDELANCFKRSRERFHYGGDFTPVYPIKVNQQYSVVKAIVENPNNKVGLESGSKTELMAVLALADPQQGIVVCNGYKDREYIRLALIGKRLGHRVFIVIEKLSELEMVLQQAADLNIEPLLGLRIRLSSVSQGLWQNTGGEKSKFGLNPTQIMAAIALLQKHRALHNLQLVHLHLGSQIPNLVHIERGMLECGRYLEELKALGCTIKYVDVGGGLGIDYDGTGTANDFSLNYTMQDYSDTIVSTLLGACERCGLTHPHIVTESGRAMTAHHAVLITNVIDVEQHITVCADSWQVRHADREPCEELNQLEACYQQLQSGTSRPLEVYSQVTTLYEKLQGQFQRGEINLKLRALAEQIYAVTCRRLTERLDGHKRAHREIIDVIKERQAEKYFLNFSLFQSLPDVWALKQVFPITPIQRLNEYPSARGVLRDITCDSDGRIDHYVDSEGVENSLPLHTLAADETYAVAIFLVGAYQEILGDMHNLFGDTHSVNVNFLRGEGYSLSNIQYGDSVDYILRHIHFDPDALRQRYQEKVENADIEAALAAAYLEELSAGLTGYSYLEQ